MRSESESINALFSPVDDSLSDDLFERIREGLGVPKGSRGHLVGDEIWRLAVTRQELAADDERTTLRAALPKFPWGESERVYFINVHFGKCFSAEGAKVADVPIWEIWYPSADVLLIVPDCQTVVGQIDDMGRVTMARLAPRECQ